MRRQRRGTYLPDGNSYWPFVVAIAAHAVATVLIVLLPSMIVEQKPEQIVTINLADMPAPPSSGAAGGPPPVKPPPEPTKIEAKSVKEKPPEPEPPKKIEQKPVKDKPVPEVQEPPPPPKVISLEPRQQVKKMPLPEPPKKDSKAVKRELSKIREQLAQEQKQRDQHKRDTAVADAREAQAEADRLTRRYEDMKAQARLLEARAQGFGSGAAKSSQSDNVASSGADSALAQQYYARIVGQLQSYWKLPDYKDWPPSLLAKVIVTIDKNGKILDVEFEKHSGDDAFDRLVRKTLSDADPLPPIPSALKKERLEFGCNFNPGGAATGR